MPGRAGRAARQAAGASARRSPRDRVHRGGPRGPARRARAGPEIVRGMNDEPAVLTERRERVLLITINRPDQRNAVNAAVAEGIAAAMDELDHTTELSVGI